VKKTSLYLDPETDRALERLAKSRGITKAETIRRVLEEAVRRVERPRISAIGVGAGPGDVAGDVDRHLEQTGFGQA
jgi:hypothetical protein